MKLHQQIDEMRRDNPHPIDVLIPSFRGMVVAIRNGKGNFKPWIRSTEHADSDEVLEFDRVGTNLYSHATGESFGAVIDVDGASHGKLMSEQIAELRSRRPELRHRRREFDIGKPGALVHLLDVAGQMHRSRTSDVGQTRAAKLKIRRRRPV